MHDVPCKCIKQVLKYGELEERRLAAERAGRGKRSDAPEASKDGGKEVGVKFAELKEAFGVSDAVPEANTGVLAMRKTDTTKRLLEVSNRARFGVTREL